MRTFLLTWNLRRWKWDGWDNLAAICEKEKPVEGRWSCGNNKGIKRGDRVFLLRQGSESPGILGAGSVVEGSHEEPAFDDEAKRRMALYVRVSWERAVPVARCLSRETLLKGILRPSLVNTRVGGVEIDAESVTRLEREWARHVGLKQAVVSLAKESSAEETKEEFESRLANIFRKAGCSVVREPRIGDAQPDLLVNTPHGKQILIEARLWPSGEDAMRRAERQVENLRQLSKIEDVFVVLPGLQDSAAKSGVVSDRDIMQVVEAIDAKASEAKLEKWEDYGNTQPLIFAAMPFAPKYNDTFDVAMKPAAITLGMTCERIDHSAKHGDIVKQVTESIDRCVAVFADVSESRPNVLWEAGYAVAKGKPVIQLCSSDLSQLPFDVRNNHTVKYEIGCTHALRQALEAELKNISNLP